MKYTPRQATIWALKICFTSAVMVTMPLRADASGEPACATVVRVEQVATSPGATSFPVSVLLTNNTSVRGVQFELPVPGDLALLECNGLAPDFTCATRPTKDGIVFVFVSFFGAPIPPGTDQPIFELIFDVSSEVLARDLALPIRDLQVLGGGYENCSAVGVAGGVQVLAGCEFYHEDMESGADGWTSSVRSTTDKVADPIGPDTWRLDDQTCVGEALGSTMYLSNGNRGPACVADSSRDLSQLLGPPIGLPQSGALSVEFDALSYDEAGECRASGQYDRHDVGVTLDGGLTYTLLNDCTALADGTGAVSHHEFDISEFAGLTVQLIFVYDTSDVLNGHSFAVDNIRINARDMICGSCEGLVLLGEPPAESPVTLEGCGAVIAGGAFHVGSSKDVTLRSGTHIVLGDGFRVDAGGRFSAVVDPGIVEVSKSPRPIPSFRINTPSRDNAKPSNRRVSDD